MNNQHSQNKKITGYKNFIIQINLFLFVIFSPLMVKILKNIDTSPPIISPKPKPGIQGIKGDPPKRLKHKGKGDNDGNTRDIIDIHTNTKEESNKWISLNPEEEIRHINFVGEFLPSLEVNPKVVAIIPTDEKSYKNVFDANFSIPKKNEMDRNYKRFSEFENSHVFSSIEIGESEFLNHIRNNPNTNPLIIVAHSKKIDTEKFIVLPNGNTIEIDDIHEVCLDINSQCLFVTCHSDDLAINNKINLDNAYSITKKGINFYNAIENEYISTNILNAFQDEGRGLTQVELMILVMRHERINQRARGLTLVGIGSTAGIRGIYVSQYSEEDQPTKTRS